MSVEGKVVVVTAAASGIGRAIALGLLRAGARVVAGDVDVAGLDALKRDAGSADLVTHRCDVTEEGDQRALMERAIEEWGHLDVAVANAGVATIAALVDHDEQHWRRVLDVSLTGTMLTIKHAAKTMDTDGSIVLIASLNATQPAKGMAAYCAAKAGVKMLADVAALELGERGIRVNTVAPGVVQTPTAAMFWTMPTLVDEFLDNTPLRRAAAPEDVAAAVRFLAGTSSAHVSGAYLEVDGGAHTGRYPDLPAAIAAAVATSKPKEEHQ
ncbi:SDR family NAD(P)-dependent oxidoreductase [Mycolicibacterium neoaurum]|uniref:SDR family NAD(P)-dependent oxidoreductase n=1 Tax=Mycolicibacterium neoaurum TaxID=1795 RepID=UPI00068B9E6B|nr:SDR family NAD(P)-dependent oxidoreductase [Mycolicibacterium neoaurum]SDC87418.1 NAD(P)-dependent dehydrogenase, short-chain alcohol dehydrogenase family [Mycolicibacterium neoaurum]